MSNDTYTITTAVHGEVWTPAGCVAFELEPGPFSPKDDAERLVLSGLVAAGIATPAAKSTKKGA